VQQIKTKRERSKIWEKEAKLKKPEPNARETKTMGKEVHLPLFGLKILDLQQNLVMSNTTALSRA